jgi:hypothetical protein
MDEKTDGYRHYAEFVTKQLTTEESAAAAFTSRAGATITTSGALVTVLLALGAIVPKGTRIDVHRSTVVLALCGLLFYLVSALMSIAVLTPSLRRSVDVDGMAAEFRSHWADPESRAARKTMATEMELLRQLQVVNDRKGSWLFVAVVAQAAATASIAVAVATVVLGR